jgi:hypothetical protein
MMEQKPGSILASSPSPLPPFPVGRGNIGEIGDLWVRCTHKSPISPFFPRPLGAGTGGGIVALICYAHEEEGKNA